MANTPCRRMRLNSVNLTIVIRALRGIRYLIRMLRQKLKIWLNRLSLDLMTAATQCIAAASTRRQLMVRRVTTLTTITILLTTIRVRMTLKLFAVRRKHSVLSRVRLITGQLIRKQARQITLRHQAKRQHIRKHLLAIRRLKQA